MRNQKALISFATGWGPKHGGINSFNYDFLRGFAAAYVDIKIICIAKLATDREIEEAARVGVDLRKLPYNNSEEVLDETIAPTLSTTILQDISGYEIICIGHDIFSGGLSNAFAKLIGAKSAVIHHMSYDSYKGYESGISTHANEKTKKQKSIFSQADFRIAVGPMLRDELRDWFGPDQCGMLIPGLPEIEPTYAPSKWTVIFFGRLSPETNKIKQTKLGVAAVAQCERDSREDAGLAKKLKDGSRIKLFGVETSGEDELREYIEEAAGSVIDIHALPYTEERTELFDALCRSSVAMMPSWHEGFGLVGWEAIAAGVPIILGRDSGLYKFLNEEFHGLATGCITTVDIRGSKNEPYFQQEDLAQVVAALKNLASDEDGARKRALSLKKLLSEYTPKRCAEDFSSFVGWKPLIESDSPIPPSTRQIQSAPNIDKFIRSPISTWDAKKGYSYSQLLRAEEEFVPFDEARENDVLDLMTWANECPYPLAIRLYTGSGGSGKTRLLLEACQRLGVDSTWTVGFLSPEMKSNELQRRIASEIAPGSKWLIGIDYAETRRDQLATVVEAAKKLTSPSIRLVLLARDAGEWWERLPTDYPQCEQIFGGNATGVPKALSPLHSDPSQRLAAYKTALIAYAKRLNIKNIDGHLKTPPDLRLEHFDRPLFLQMAALLALHGEHADSANGLTEAILRHELRYWKALALAEGIDDGDRIISVVMVLSTLAGGLATEREAWDSLNRSGLLLPAKSDFTKLFRALCPLYPGRQGLQPLRPDLLGEALVASALSSNHSDTMLDSALNSGISSQKREHALVVLTRSVRLRPGTQVIFQESLCRNFRTIWRDIIKAGQEVGQPLVSISCMAYRTISPAARIQIAGPVGKELRGSSVAWDSLALLAADSEVEKIQHKLDRLSGTARENARVQYGHALSNRSLAYHYSGNDTAALLDSQQAASLFRRAKDRSKSDLSNYCWSLNSTSNRHGNLGNYQKAFLDASEALEHAKILKEHSSKDFSTLYSSILTNLSAIQADLGQYADALLSAQTSVEIYKSIEQNSQIVHDKATHARMLGNLSLRYDDSGDLENCLHCAIESSDILSEISPLYPDRYTSDYATSLINLGATYYSLSDYEKHSMLTTQAVEILKPIAEKRPERFASVFAISLMNLSECQALQGQYEDGCQSAEKATSIYRTLEIEYKLNIHLEHAAAAITLAKRYADKGDFLAAVTSCKVAEEKLLEEKIRQPGGNPLDEIRQAFLSCLCNWLADQNVDIDGLKARELSRRDRVAPSMQLEIQVSVLFVSACVIAKTSRILAAEGFEDVLKFISTKTAPIGVNLAIFEAISSIFIASIEFDSESKIQKGRRAWSALSKYYPQSIPAWVNCTLEKIRFNENSAPLNLITLPLDTSEK